MRTTRRLRTTRPRKPSLPRPRVLYALAALLAACVAVAACNAVLGTNDINVDPGVCLSDGDCGGGSGQFCTDAGRCAITNGVACNAAVDGGECASGFCSSTDGICCAEPCGEACQTCSGGTCARVDAGDQGACGAGQACNAAGACANADGQLCDAGADAAGCASGSCSEVDNVCCAETCTPCQTCTGGAACSQLAAGAEGACPASHACNATGACANANGRPCDTTVDGGDCASSFCSDLDNVCCAETCSGPCHVCPDGASCSQLAVGVQGACPASHACSAVGTCYCPSQTFAHLSLPHAAYLTGMMPTSVVAADLNGDGKPDLAVANSMDATVSVLLSKSDGSFRHTVTYSTGTSPSAVAAADLNGDGKPDLAVANNGDHTVTVLLNNGDGTFATHAGPPPTGHAPNAVAIADLNGDGKSDLVVANSADDTVSVLLGKGDGTFQSQMPFPVGLTPQSIAVLDLNHDGKLDLVVANSGGTNVSVLLGKGDGTFQSQTKFPVGTAPYSVAALDLNDDGKPDLAVANYGDGTVSVLFGNGDGTFSASVPLGTGNAPYSVVALDLNGDGKPDLAVANYDDNDVSVLLGKGDGTFQSQMTFAVGAFPDSVTSADLDGDGKPDLAVANNGDGTVSVLLNDGDGSGGFHVPTTPNTYATGASPSSVAAADLSGDGRPDLAVANAGAGTVSVLIDDTALADGGAGDSGAAPVTFAAQVTYLTGTKPSSVAAADLNGDGKLDLAVANNGDGTVSVLINQGGGTFGNGPYPAYPTGSAPLSVVAVDLNGDAKPDLAVANQDDGTVSVLINQGGGTFATDAGPYPAYPTGKYPSSVAAADLNGDGKLDLAVVNSGDDTVSVLINQGGGTFGTGPYPAYPTGGVPTAVVAADLNGDGKPDLAITSKGDDTVSVLINQGDGTFATDAGPYPAYPTGSAPLSVIAVDLNGDGVLDLAVTSFGDGNVSVLLNNGDGTFAPAVDYPTGLGPFSVAALDLSDGGLPDLAVANQTDGNVTVLLNTCGP